MWVTISKIQFYRIYDFDTHIDLLNLDVTLINISFIPCLIAEDLLFIPTSYRLI